MLNTEDLAPGFAISAGLYFFGGGGGGVGWDLERAKRVSMRASLEGKAVRNHMISRGFWAHTTFRLHFSGTILVHVHIIALLSRHFEFS